jgi:hypothetical protein
MHGKICRCERFVPGLRLAKFVPAIQKALYCQSLAQDRRLGTRFALVMAVSIGEQ